MSGQTERDFDTAIEAGLTNAGGYETWSLNAYDEAGALFPADVTGFPNRNQLAMRQALKALLGPKIAATGLEVPSAEPEREHTLNTAGIEMAIAARLPIDARPAPSIRFEARFGSNRFDR